MSRATSALSLGDWGAPLGGASPEVDCSAFVRCCCPEGVDGAAYGAFKPKPKPHPHPTLDVPLGERSSVLAGLVATATSTEGLALSLVLSLAAIAGAAAGLAAGPVTGAASAGSWGRKDAEGRAITPPVTGATDTSSAPMGGGGLAGLTVVASAAMSLRLVQAFLTCASESSGTCRQW